MKQYHVFFGSWKYKWHFPNAHKQGSEFLNKMHDVSCEEGQWLANVAVNDFIGIGQSCQKGEGQ